MSVGVVQAKIQSEANDNVNDEKQFSYSVMIPKTKTTLFSLVVRYISCGASFQMVSNIIGCTYNVLGDLCLHACSRQDVSKFIRVVYAINLQRIVDVLRCSWGFSTAFNFATHKSTSYLDLRFCVFIEEHNTIVNLHGCVLPMFDRHTGEIMFDMVNKFLTVFCLDWMIHFIGLASDGARNMIGHVVGVVTRLDVAMHDDCPLIRIWCGVHQLYLVMEHIMNDVVKERFFTIMTGFITHITRQQKLIMDMNTTCPRIVNRWLSTEKVIKWFKIHRPELLAHIESKQPASTSPCLW